MFSPVLVSRTVAPATTAPEESRTVPSTTPKVDWASVTWHTPKISNTPTKKFFMRSGPPCRRNNHCTQAVFQARDDSLRRLSGINLELVAQSELHDPGTAIPDRLDVIEVSGCRFVEIAVRYQEIRMVENVECLPAQLDKLSLTDGESLEHAQIDVLRARGVQNASSGIARREGYEAILVGRASGAVDAAGRVDEGVRVVPRIIDPAPAGAGNVLAGGNAIGPQRLAQGGVDGGVFDRKRGARTVRGGAGKLPSAQESIG